MVVSVGAPAPLIIRANPALPLWLEKASPSSPAARQAALIRSAICWVEQSENTVLRSRMLWPEGVQGPQAGGGDGHHGAPPSENGNDNYSD